MEVSRQWTVYIIIGCMLLIAVYVLWHRRRQKSEPIMRFFADLHIHSRYSRATSPEMSLESLWRWAQMKGITVIGTGDFPTLNGYRN